MARVAEIDRMLWEWAEQRGSGQNAKASVLDIEATLAVLPPKLKATLEEVYVGRGSSAEICRRLGCPESTIVRRLGRAHLLLSDLLAMRREERRRGEHEATVGRPPSE